jgi:hypothetical protein
MRLATDNPEREDCGTKQVPFGPFEGCVPLWRVGCGFLGCLLGAVEVSWESSVTAFGGVLGAGAFCYR